ncbi:hypothetical protein APY04_2800 [Hyphomicrobium sulfonivorans]|uniref:Uncharacterized protein n=1 Tax=Hyphomicrobium sulfonivorans TaxID=121290 RepID=A0A120CU21_HYPSL|nr:hypothetical protein APY04_2800 [Hyphomicrobium sulfonivorans]
MLKSPCQIWLFALSATYCLREIPEFVDVCNDFGGKRRIL